jgi:nicotinamidase-related amidase
MPARGEPFALDPARSALLVVDMQNDFVREDAPQEVPQARLVIGTIAGLAAAFRDSGRPVVYTRFTAGPQRTLLLERVVVSDGVASFDDELASATLRNLAMKFGRVEPARTVLAALRPAAA